MDRLYESGLQIGTCVLKVTSSDFGPEVDIPNEALDLPTVSDRTRCKIVAPTITLLSMLALRMVLTRFASLFNLAMARISLLMVLPRACLVSNASLRILRNL